MRTLKKEKENVLYLSAPVTPSGSLRFERFLSVKKYLIKKTICNDASTLTLFCKQLVLCLILRIEKSYIRQYA